ncbi:MAG: hypothetical protein WCF17_21035 [Terracidiphilus sp.]
MGEKYKKNDDVEWIEQVKGKNCTHCPFSDSEKRTKARSGNENTFWSGAVLCCSWYS